MPGAGRATMTRTVTNITLSHIEERSYLSASMVSSQPRTWHTVVFVCVVTSTAGAEKVRLPGVETMMD